ncbi:MAG: hypothetical protein HY365_02815 [Candidatus Aenigmarchaeota archaeon]|nr:hypothetical protein [Candidatus Aenigmarchaeota archaeon]
MEAYPLALGSVLFAAHYFSGKIGVRHRTALLSFSVGVSLAYVFLYLIPESISLAGLHEKHVFLFMLIGIAAARLVDVHIKRHARPLLRKEVRELHSAGFATYGFFTGVLISGLYAISATAAFLLFAATLFHSVAGSASINEIHASMSRNAAARAALSAAPLIGAAAGQFFTLSPVTFSAVLGAIVGIMLYVVIRDTMPDEKKSMPGYFAAGILAFYVAMELAAAFS